MIIRCIQSITIGNPVASWQVSKLVEGETYNTENGLPLETATAACERGYAVEVKQKQLKTRTVTKESKTSKNTKAGE